MSEKLRVGIVGAGYVSNHHIRAVKDLDFTEVVGICDTDPVKAKATAEKHAIPGVFNSLSAMAAARPDVIHVLTPPSSHCALTLEALDMGCHVFVEKPMAETVDECDRMIARAREKQRVLSINHSARFDPAVLKADELVRSGAIGEVVAVHFIRSSDYPPYAGGPLPPPYRQGSYPFRDLGVHGLYLLELFLGPVKKLDVTWRGSGRDPMLALDEWRATAESEKGSGYMFLSWNSRPIQNELLIHGTKGTIHVDCFLQTCELMGLLPGPKQIGMVIVGTINAAKRLWRVPVNMLRFITGSLKPSPGIYKGVQDFYQALKTNSAPPVSPEEGRRMIAMVEEAAAPADREVTAKLASAASETPAPARVLVTGGNGFLGSELVRTLRERGESFRLLLRRPPTQDTGAASIVLGSLGQPDVVDRAVAGVEVVYHVGAAMKGGAAAFDEGTVWGTRNIIESCLKHNVKRLVYVSSLSVLDHAGHKTGDPVTEKSALEPEPANRGTYTRTKMEAEDMVLKAARERGLPAVIIRPGQIFGPGAEKVTPNGVFQIAGIWFVAGSGDRQIPLIYRDDVVDALLAAETSEKATGEIINVVDTTKIVQNDYLKAAKPALGKTKILKAPVPFFMALGYGVELLGKALKRGAPLSRYKIRSLKPLAPFDVTKAADLLGWNPRVGVAEGLRRTFRS